MLVRGHVAICLELCQTPQCERDNNYKQGEIYEKVKTLAVSRGLSGCLL